MASWTGRGRGNYLRGGYQPSDHMAYNQTWGSERFQSRQRPGSGFYTSRSRAPAFVPSPDVSFTEDDIENELNYWESYPEAYGGHSYHSSYETGYTEKTYTRYNGNMQVYNRSWDREYDALRTSCGYPYNKNAHFDAEWYRYCHENQYTRHGKALLRKPGQQLQGSRHSPSKLSLTGTYSQAAYKYQKENSNTQRSRSSSPLNRKVPVLYSVSEATVCKEEQKPVSKKWSEPSVSKESSGDRKATNQIQGNMSSSPGTHKESGSVVTADPKTIVSSQKVAETGPDKSATVVEKCYKRCCADLSVGLKEMQSPISTVIGMGQGRNKDTLKCSASKTGLTPSSYLKAVQMVYPSNQQNSIQNTEAVKEENCRTENINERNMLKEPVVAERSFMARSDCRSVKKLFTDNIEVRNVKPGRSDKLNEHQKSMFKTGNEANGEKRIVTHKNLKEVNKAAATVSAEPLAVEGLGSEKIERCEKDFVSELQEKDDRLQITPKNLHAGDTQGENEAESKVDSPNEAYGNDFDTEKKEHDKSIDASRQRTEYRSLKDRGVGKHNLKKNIQKLKTVKKRGIEYLAQTFDGLLISDKSEIDSAPDTGSENSQPSKQCREFLSAENFDSNIECSKLSPNVNTGNDDPHSVLIYRHMQKVKSRSLVHEMHGSFEPLETECNSELVDNFTFENTVEIKEDTSACHIEIFENLNSTVGSSEDEGINEEVDSELEENCRLSIYFSNTDSETESHNLTLREKTQNEDAHSTLVSRHLQKIKKMSLVQEIHGSVDSLETESVTDNLDNSASVASSESDMQSLIYKSTDLHGKSQQNVEDSKRSTFLENTLKLKEDNSAFETEISETFESDREPTADDTVNEKVESELEDSCSQNIDSDFESGKLSRSEYTRIEDPHSVLISRHMQKIKKKSLVQEIHGSVESLETEYDIENSDRSSCLESSVEMIEDTSDFDIEIIENFESSVDSKEDEKMNEEVQEVTLIDINEGEDTHMDHTVTASDKTLGTENVYLRESGITCTSNMETQENILLSDNLLTDKRKDTFNEEEHLIVEGMAGDSSDTVESCVTDNPKTTEADWIKKFNIKPAFVDLGSPCKAANWRTEGKENVEPSVKAKGIGKTGTKSVDERGQNVSGKADSTKKSRALAVKNRDTKSAGQVNVTPDESNFLSDRPDNVATCSKVVPNLGASESLVDTETPSDHENRITHVIPLSQRFGQISNSDRQVSSLGCEEKLYKTEFQNVINAMKSRSDEQGIVEASELVAENMEEESEVSGLSDPRPGTSSGRDAGGTDDIEAEDDINIRRNRKHYTSSPESFLDYSDNDDDDDDDDESDDDFLTTPAAFLKSVEQMSGRHVEVTPTKLDTGDDVVASTSKDRVTVEYQRAAPKGKFDLDRLLADHERKADLVREMDDINRQLQDELKEGGFLRILKKHETSYTESQITEEQRSVLQHLEVHETSIQDVRPGELVFQPQLYGQLFNHCLHPTHCGYSVGSNGLSLEKHIQSITPDQYKLLISSGIIIQCFTKISCQSPLLRWLFFIMSTHTDHLVQRGCKNVLTEILHYQQLYGAAKWTPSLTDVLSVFVNYGASLEKLMCCSSSTVEDMRGRLIQHPGYSPPQNVEQLGYGPENLMLVLQILALALQGQSGRYRAADLSTLCVILCKASLDRALKNCCADRSFQNCVAMAVKHYNDPDWLEERLTLTRKLLDVATHHHDRVHVARLLPAGARGSYVQRRYSYLALTEILIGSAEVPDDKLDNLEIQDLEPFVGYIRDLLESDSYKLSSVISLMDLAVGANLTLKSTQREQLKSLLDNVRRVRVKDNVSFLDRTRVKDSIVRMTSKWALDIQTMKGKQTKIFEYAASPVKMQIETIRTVQTEESDSENEMPAKVQKLSPSTESC